MIKILVIAGSELIGPITDSLLNTDRNCYHVGGVDYPVDLVEVHEVEELPEGFNAPDYHFVDGELILRPPTLAALKKARNEAATSIESQVLAVYSKPIILKTVYEAREAEAIAFQEANYEGVPGQYLRDFADPAGLTYQAAADLVLEQATNFREALPELEALRMQKYAVARSTSLAAIQSIVDDFEAALAEIVATIS